MSKEAILAGLSRALSNIVPHEPEAAARDLANLVGYGAEVVFGIKGPNPQRFVQVEYEGSRERFFADDIDEAFTQAFAWALFSKLGGSL